ncbi:MAG: HAMP domain-containing histidine kinase [Ruminococcus sp.]|nr:HAMP domain-containing histidine kinase [Ruminococcus sp.]
MQIREFLHQKVTRIVAFISASVIFAVCIGFCINRYISTSIYLNSVTSNQTDNYQFSEERQELFSELWVIGTMYLRNLDSNGKFTGSKALEKSTKNTLRELGLMDENDKITINSGDKFRYFVTWNDNSISSDKDIDDDINYFTEYCDIYNKGSYNIGSGYIYSSYYPSFNWYESDYGMTYYDFPHEIAGKQASAVYSYDTSKLDYSLDALNVKIYDKPDGTPAVFDLNEAKIGTKIENYGYYGDDVEYAVLPPIPATVSDDFNYQNYYLYFDSENQTWAKIKKSPVWKGDVSRLKIGIKPVDDIINNMVFMKNISENEEVNFYNYIAEFIPFVIFSLLLMLFFVVTSGHVSTATKSITADDYENKTYGLSPPDKLWVELVLAISGVAVLIAMLFVQEIDEASSMSADLFADKSTIPAILWASVITVCFDVLVLSVNTIIKRFKLKCFYQTTFIRHIINILIKIFRKFNKNIQSVIKTLSDFRISKEMADSEVIAKRFFIRLGLLAGGILGTFILNIDKIFIFLLCAIYVYLSFKDIVSLVQLSRQINDIYNGNYSDTQIAQNSPVFSLSQKLNNISAGIQNAVDKKIQSEKMKIDLVTNVSHDLKTPLTSIISYINLLSMENDLSPVARDYVQILEKKSARLSEIVADVFDIAKATSRTDINFEMIDATILLEQVLADMTDDIEASGRDIRKSICADSTPIFADGNRLYRVIQNVINNALKYSLENTRIYIILNVYSGDVVITVKNISSYEIKYTPEELTERFTRGDESRTTEGSGLGLSIAKSFTEACNGKFEINIDGDVFTAKIQLPITKEMPD